MRDLLSSGQWSGGYGRPPLKNIYTDYNKEYTEKFVLITILLRQVKSSLAC